MNGRSIRFSVAPIQLKPSPDFLGLVCIYFKELFIFIVWQDQQKAASGVGGSRKEY